MNEVIKQSIEILFKNRMLKVVVSKHFVERLVDRKIELPLLSSALNRIADNVCLIAYTAQLVGDKVNVKFGGYHFIVNFKENKLHLITVLRPYTLYDRDVHLVLE